MTLSLPRLRWPRPPHPPRHHPLSLRPPPPPTPHGPLQGLQRSAASLAASKDVITSTATILSPTSSAPAAVSTAAGLLRAGLSHGRPCARSASERALLLLLLLLLLLRASLCVYAYDSIYPFCGREFPWLFSHAKYRFRPPSKPGIQRFATTKSSLCEQQASDRLARCHQITNTENVYQSLSVTQ